MRLSGRDLAVDAELALDAKGNFLAMRGSNISNLGAHTTNFSPLQKGVEIMTSIYRVPAAHFRARAVLTNTSPTRPYRSAGRPEVMFVMERLIDLAAREHGFDRVAHPPAQSRDRKRVAVHQSVRHRLRQRRLHRRHGLGAAARRLGGLQRRRAEARKRGRYRGIGVANYVDTATGVPRERAEITVEPDGFVES